MQTEATWNQKGTKMIQRVSKMLQNSIYFKASIKYVKAS